MTQQHPKIAFIGAGNMTQSIIGGMVDGGYPAKSIYVSNPSPTKLEALAKQHNVNTNQSNRAVAEQADIVILAVKPQLMKDVCSALKDEVSDLSDKLIVTIAAGIRMPNYENYLGQPLRIIRVMPNTPSLVGEGVSGLVANERATAQDKDIMTEAFTNVGNVLWVNDEDELDILGAVSGSGPAYFFEFMASLQKAAIALGFDRDKAREMVQQTALGAAVMASKSTLELEELRAQVTSKGGSTAKGVEVYQEADLDNISSKAVQAAVKRNQEMAKLF